MLFQLLMNNLLQFVCLWCCVPPDFVVQINKFFILVLPSAVIHERRGKKLISKTTKYKLDSSSKMQFVFFHPKDLFYFICFIHLKICLETIDSVKYLEMTQIVGGRGSCFFVIMTQCVQKSICDSPLIRKIKNEFKMFSFTTTAQHNASTNCTTNYKSNLLLLT